MVEEGAKEAERVGYVKFPRRIGVHGQCDDGCLDADHQVEGHHRRQFPLDAYSQGPGRAACATNSSYLPGSPCGPVLGLMRMPKGRSRC